MRKKLFEEVFKKAEERSPSKTRNGVCTFLENAFSEMDRYSFGKETFIRYYKKYREGRNIKYNPNAELLNKCAQYLGYEDYEDFVLKNKGQEEPEVSDEQGTISTSLIIWLQKNKKLVIINMILLVAIISIISTDILSKNQEKWMTWKENRYVEATFSITEYYNDQLVPYDQNKIDFFKEVENPDCKTKYFNKNGKPILWYYKVGKGDLELYTSSGFHPENGKPLKHITRYMIQEHICPEY